MRCVNVREARERISRILAEVERGEEVIIARHGRPVARLTPVSGISPFPDRSAFRKSLSKVSTNSGELLRELRDDERY